MTAEAPPPRRSWVEHIMGMPISVLGRGVGATTADAQCAVDTAFAELRDVDAAYSTYRSDSILSRLNDGRLTLGDCPAEFRDVAEACAEARTITGGLFDATTPDGRWDPSGYVKGWAAERAFRYLAAVPDADWLLNAGGDVVVLCTPNSPFRVGIADPKDPARLAAVAQLHRGALATSGTAVRGAHLYDPRTGGAADAHWASVTVTGPSLTMADVLATAGFVAGAEWSAVVSSVPDFSGLAIATDGGQFSVGAWPGIG